MNTVLYRNNLNSPVILNVSPIEIKPPSSKISIGSFSSKNKSKWVLSNFINSERNSRLNSDLPLNKLWEVKWKTPLDSSLIPWFITAKGERLLIQNESGWQLFDISGKNITNGVMSEGEILIDPELPLFYYNEPSGYVAAVNIQSGEEQFLFYPYLGNAYSRTVLYSSENKIISVGRELPVMTHNSSIKTPELLMFELLDLGTSREKDEDGILDTAVQVDNLICKSSKSVYANSDSNIVLAVPNHIYFIDMNLQVVKDLESKFTPLEISIDEEMRIYLIAESMYDDNIETELWIIDSNGSLISKTIIDSIPPNYLSPPIIDNNHNVYIRYENRVTAINSEGKIMWGKYTQKPLSGISAAGNLLLCSEGNTLTAFDNTGERMFIFKLDEEIISTCAILIENEIYIATKNFLYCLVPKN